MSHEKPANEMYFAIKCKHNAKCGYGGSLEFLKMMALDVKIVIEDYQLLQDLPILTFVSGDRVMDA